MAAEKTIRYRGMDIRIWKTCFTVEGMSCTISSAGYESEADRLRGIKNLIDAIFSCIVDEARAEAKDSLVQSFSRMLDKM